MARFLNSKLITIVSAVFCRPDTLLLIFRLVTDDFSNESKVKFSVIILARASLLGALMAYLSAMFMK